MSTRPLAYTRTLCFLLGGLVALSAYVVIWPGAFMAPASAEAPCTADGDEGLLAAWEGYQTPHWTESRGTRSDVWIPNDGAPCQRIASIYVVGPSGSGNIEWGDVVGYTNDSCNSIPSHYHNTPTMFYFVGRSDGGFTCVTLESVHPTPGTYKTFTVADLDGNKVFRLYMDGTDEGGIQTDFATGSDLIGMERGASSDSGWSEFTSLNENHASFGWTNWDDIGSFAGDFDCWYHWEFPNNHTAHIRHNSTPVC